MGGGGGGMANRIFFATMNNCKIDPMHVSTIRGGGGGGRGCPRHEGKSEDSSRGAAKYLQGGVGGP